MIDVYSKEGQKMVRQNLEESGNPLDMAVKKLDKTLPQHGLSARVSFAGTEACFDIVDAEGNRVISLRQDLRTNRMNWAVPVTGTEYDSYQTSKTV